VVESCWKKIGTQGDGSCPELAELSHCRNCATYSRAGRELLDREMPDSDRAEWTAILAEEKQATGGTVSLMVFRVGSEWLALPTATLEQVVEERPVHVVPDRSNRKFRGLVNIDGELLLCYSAARLLGIEEEGSPRRMLVAAKGSERMVFSVDEVRGVLRVAEADLGEPPATVERSPAALTKAVFPLDERQAGLLDTDRWFQCAARSLA
jgi:chemotaxis-related protein WspD